MELTKVIANNIVRLLEENNRTQAELSTYLDISRQTLSNYLKGNSTIDSVRLVKTADFFNIPVTALLETTAVSRAPMLLRAAPQDHDAIEDIEDLISDYLARYEELCSKVGCASHFFPEQHDLFIEHAGKRISVNHELRKYPPKKFKIDNQLRDDIYAIADNQRRVLGLSECGAIELIKALTARGINVIFLDFKLTSIFGLSTCGNSQGCYIFVNSNESITVERQLFTVAHEYAHLILHRPLFSNDSNVPMSSQYVELLDKMADTFAGRLLCPPDIVLAYEKHYSASNSTLKSISPITVRLKQKLHVSFQSLLIALESYGLVSKSVVNEYFRWANSNNSLKDEPWSIKDDRILYGQFEEAKEEHIIEIFHKLFMKEKEAVSEDDIMFFLGCDIEKANTILGKFESELEKFNEFDDIFD